MNIDEVTKELIKSNLHRGTKGYRQYKRWATKFKAFSQGNMERYCWKRHDRIVKRYYPGLLKIDNLEGLKQKRVIEIGCGSGSASLAFASLTRELIGIDIEPKGIRAAKKRAICFGQDNTEFILLKPEKIVDKALELMEPNSIILLYAVLEHMTEEERLNILKLIWDSMTNDNVLIIGELPNRLCYFDEHTYLKPFIHLLPNYTFYEFCAVDQFRLSNHFKTLPDNKDKALERSRRGMGCSFHEFFISFKQPLDGLVAYSFVKPESKEEHFLVEVFNKYNIEVPVVFACQMMHFVIKKFSEGVNRDELSMSNKLERRSYPVSVNYPYPKGIGPS